ncbi:hypothetical protein H0H87_012626 [Tephrocybe sp. NHM501043]|nr:hypothetical protein H0H87_012626 [Tephrocybe sp. NHM501043]
MFTPPPSPQPDMKDDSPRTPVLEAGTKNFPPVVDPKRRIGRKTRLTVILIPLTLILITVSTRYLMHPGVFDLFVSAPGSLSWQDISSKGLLWQTHKRHESHERRQVSTAPSVTTNSPTSTTSASPTVSANVPVPTIPSSPPSLPTPFPQPFDTDLSTNYSSLSCFNFFSNLTTAAPFRSCRPLSFLVDTSNSFIDAQQNLTLLNTIIWGTCNTTTAEDQCISNMGWFAAELQKACAQDLQDQNAMAVGALRDFRSYSLYREVGCLTDPTSNTYCYLNAVRNSASSDVYFYQLPLGLVPPKSTNLTCSACTRSLMTTYSAALADPVQADLLTGLKKTYADAANLAVAQCGSGYADTSVASGATATLLQSRTWWIGLTLLLSGAIVQSFS